MNRVIITGGNGFIGKHVVKKFLDYNPQSLAVISNTECREGFLLKRKLIRDTPLRSYTADIRDRKAISDIFLQEKADTCIHLAAKISVADSLKNPDETMQVNVNGTLNVLEACHNSKVNNFVFASSAAVYGDVSQLPISENCTLKPLSPYGTSKMLAERHIRRYERSKKIQNSAALRIFNVYGPGNVSQSDVISKFAGRIVKGLPPIIYGDGRHTRDFVYVGDVANAILLSVKYMETKRNDNENLNFSPVFNIGSGTGTSINEIARKMIVLSGLQVEPIYQSEDQDSGVILHSYANVAKTKKTLRFAATKELEEGLKEVVEQKNFQGQKT